MADHGLRFLYYVSWSRVFFGFLFPEVGGLHNYFKCVTEQKSTNNKSYRKLQIAADERLLLERVILTIEVTQLCFLYHVCVMTPVLFSECRLIFLGNVAGFGNPVMASVKGCNCVTMSLMTCKLTSVITQKN